MKWQPGGGRASLFLGFSCQPCEGKDYYIRSGTVKIPGEGLVFHTHRLEPGHFLRGKG